MNLISLLADGLKLFHIFDLVLIASSLTAAVLGAIFIPLFRRHGQHFKELHAMASRTLVESTSIMLFGKFGKKVQSEFLGKTLTNMFGTVLSELITAWDETHENAIVVPDDEDQAAHMRYFASAEASCFILQSQGLGVYFRNMEVIGTSPEYPFSRILVAVACPKADRLTTHRHPRIIAISESDLMRIADDPDTQPQWDTQDGWTWLDVLREMAKLYRTGKQNGIEVLELPNAHKPMNTELG